MPTAQGDSCAQSLSSRSPHPKTGLTKPPGPVSARFPLHQKPDSVEKHSPRTKASHQPSCNRGFWVITIACKNKSLCVYYYLVPISTGIRLRRRGFGGRRAHFPIVMPISTGIRLRHCRDLPSYSIAVGIHITGHPPHRFQRAQFAHRAPTLGAWWQSVRLATVEERAALVATHQQFVPSVPIASGLSGFAAEACAARGRRHNAGRHSDSGYWSAPHGSKESRHPSPTTHRSERRSLSSEPCRPLTKTGCVAFLCCRLPLIYVDQRTIDLTDHTHKTGEQLANSV